MPKRSSALYSSHSRLPDLLARSLNRLSIGTMGLRGGGSYEPKSPRAERPCIGLGLEALGMDLHISQDQDGAQPRNPAHREADHPTPTWVVGRAEHASAGWVKWRKAHSDAVIGPVKPACGDVAFLGCSPGQHPRSSRKGDTFPLQQGGEGQAQEIARSK